MVKEYQVTQSHPRIHNKSTFPPNTLYVNFVGLQYNVNVLFCAIHYVPFSGATRFFVNCSACMCPGCFSFEVRASRSLLARLDFESPVSCFKDAIQHTVVQSSATPVFRTNLVWFFCRVKLATATMKPILWTMYCRVHAGVLFHQQQGRWLVRVHEAGESAPCFFFVFVFFCSNK